MKRNRFVKTLRTVVLCLCAMIASAAPNVSVCAEEFKIEPPQNIKLTNDSDYEQPDNYRFRLRYGFDKGDDLLSIMNLSKTELKERYGYESYEAQIQIDWSLNSDSDWKYNSLWDKMQGVSGEPVWEYYKTDVELNNKKTDSRQILFLYNESLPQWYDENYGMSRWFSNLTYTKTNNRGYIVDYLDLNQHTIYTRSRFIVRFFSADGVEKYVMSDWSQVVGIGKGIEVTPGETENGGKVYDAYGPLETEINFSTVSQWAAADIESANENRIIPSEFKDADMSKEISRLDFAAAAVTLYEKVYNIEAVPEKENPFVDTKDKNALKAKKLGIIQGVSENEFAPDAMLTREEAAVILYRIIGGKAVIENKNGINFADDSEISDWAKEAVYVMSVNDIIRGRDDNMFCPKERLTYEECIILDLRILNLQAEN